VSSPSGFIDSSPDPVGRSRVEDAVARGRVRILYLAPERFGDAGALLHSAGVRAKVVARSRPPPEEGFDFEGRIRPWSWPVHVRLRRPRPSPVFEV